MTSPPPAGWYPDPDRPGGKRYFDGVWTEHRVDPPAAPPPRPGPLPPTPETIALRRTNLRQLLMIVGALVVVLLVVVGVYAAWPESAADKRAAQIKKDCYTLESSTARLSAVLGHVPSYNEQVAMYGRCVDAGGPQNMTP